MSTQKEGQEAILKSVAEAVNEHLKPGRTYHQEVIRSGSGSSSGSIFFFEDERPNVKIEMRNREIDRSEVDKIDDILMDLPRDSDLSALYRPLPSQTKVSFIFRKDRPLEMKVFGANDLIESMRQYATAVASRRADKDNPFTHMEALIRFEEQADETSWFVDATSHFTTGKTSQNYLQHDGMMKCLYKALEGKVEQLYLRFDSEKALVKSKPAFPELDFEVLDVQQIELESNYAERKALYQAAVDKRHEVYRSFGELDERSIYLSVGGFRSRPWPEDSMNHISAKFRVIYTEHTTILISDGLSDLFMDPRSGEPQKKQGIEAEFYVELLGKVPFEVLKEHFCVAVLNGVTQTALGLKSFKRWMKKHELATIEFNADTTEMWVVKDLGSNHGMKTFFTEEQTQGSKDFGVLLGMESKYVPATMRLNRKEIMLCNVKIHDASWLAKDKLGTNDSALEAQVRKDMVEHYNKAGERNCIPLTYHEHYVETAPESGGVVFSRLIPGF